MFLHKSILAIDIAEGSGSEKHDIQMCREM